MRSLWVALVAVLLFVFSQAASSEQASSPSPLNFPEKYSIETSIRQGSIKSSQKVFFDGKKSRVEVAGSVLINRPDLKRLYTLSSSSRTYTEQTLPMIGNLENPAASSEAQWILVGQETVNQVVCDKYLMKVPVRLPNGALIANVSTYWIDPARKLPVRTMEGQGPSAAITDFRKIDLTPPAPALFEVPPDFRRATAEEELQKQMPPVNAGEELFGPSDFNKPANVSKKGKGPAAKGK